MSVTVDGLHVTYGTNTVLAGVNLDIADGERFAIMGPSGSGKSSLIRAIAGVIPSTGTIVIDDVDVSEWPPHDRPVGLMFQDYALFPHLDVTGNVAYGLRVKGATRSEWTNRVEELLTLVGLDGYGPRNVASLSGGEQQRVALARTLAPSPALLMLDEPLGSLDLALRESLLMHMRTVVEELGTTTMYVTHDRSEAFAFADRVAVLIGGTIAAQDTPERMWHNPGSVDVARLIGHPNVVNGEALGLADRWFAIPPSAISIDDDGMLGGSAVDSIFTDGGYHTSIDINGTTLRALTQHAVPTNTALSVSIDRSQLVHLANGG